MHGQYEDIIKLRGHTSSSGLLDLTTWNYGTLKCQNLHHFRGNTLKIFQIWFGLLLPRQPIEVKAGGTKLLTRYVPSRSGRPDPCDCAFTSMSLSSKKHHHNRLKGFLFLERLKGFIPSPWSICHLNIAAMQIKTYTKWNYVVYMYVEESNSSDLLAPRGELPC